MNPDTSEISEILKELIDKTRDLASEQLTLALEASRDKNEAERIIHLNKEKSYAKIARHLEKALYILGEV
jgi:hypothetical protein